MREGWKVAKLEDVAQVVNGGTPKTKVPEYWGGEHFWITPAEMGGLESPYIESSRRCLTDAGLKNSSASLLPRNSVILSTRAPIGHLVINAERMAFNQGCRGLIPRGEAHYKYLYYFLYGSVNLLNDLGSGTTFKELSAGKLKKVEVPLPPLSEQKRIVAILDEAFAGIATAVANTEKNLANARELFESYLNSVIGGYANKYELTELHRVADFQGGSQPPKSVFLREPRDGYVRLLQIRDFKSDEKAVFIPVSRKNRLCEPSDIMIGRYGASVGQIHTGKGGAYNVALIKATPNKERLNKRYFYYYLLSNLFQQPLASVASRSAQAGFSKEDIARFAVPLPPIREQERAVESFDDLHGQVVRLEKLFESKLSSLNELKQSLLQKAFSGELTAGKAASDAMRQVEEIA